MPNLSSPALLISAHIATAQTYQRLDTSSKLCCLLTLGQADFLPGPTNRGRSRVEPQAHHQETLVPADDTIRRTIEQLKNISILEETQIVVTADHGHGFDVFGSADTKYIAETDGMRSKRKAIGVYGQSGEPRYTKPVPGVSYSTGTNFPMNWEPRCDIAAGSTGVPGHHQNYRVHYI
ncbi:hypothetical protein BROUX41_002749 [Berkeleyomyces rouxiae]|uniref:uncharacterized protein n=1 Tax=Berkeleyomyces rouxiae TaxID=2035830 RepID=UPI003B797CB3